MIAKLIRSVAVAWLVVCISASMLGCMRAKAKTAPESPPLDIPLPPPRDIEPVETETPQPMPLPQEPARSAPPRPRPAPPSTQAPRANEPPRAEPPKPEPPPAIEPARPEEPVRPPATLQTTPAQADVEVERHIRQTMVQAMADLNRVDYRVLNSDARTQYDTAKSFIRQAESALNRKNLEFAKTLAEKAAALATQLVRK